MRESRYANPEQLTLVGEWPINSRMIEARQFMIEEQQFEVGKKQFEVEKKQATASLVVEVIILAVLVADLLFIAYPYFAK